MTTHILIIARHTLLEAINRRLILAGVLLSLAFLGLFLAGCLFLQGRVQAAATNPQALPLFGAVQTLLGLYAVYVLGAMLALFVSVGAVSGEIDGGTLQALLARPIRRGAYIVGRWLTFTLIVALYVAAMAGALLLIARAVTGYAAPDPLSATGLMVLSAVLLVSLSLLGSTLLPTLANGVVVFSLFGLAWLGGIIEFVGGALRNDAMRDLGIAVSLLVPSDALWRGASYYVQSPLLLAANSAAAANAGGLPFISTVPPTAAMVAWSAVYPLIALALAIAAFARRDL